MKEILEIRDDVETHWVGDGFPVRTYFSYQKDNELCTPFLLLDYAGPHEFTPTNQRRGVGEHPHRGFETVSIIYQGELEHRDSGGEHKGTLRAGDVQWMTAGSGVVHEEFHSEGFSSAGGTLEMIQLWINLPTSQKMSAPRYQEINSKQIPKVDIDSGSIRVIAGEFDGIKGPADTFTTLHLWDLSLTKGGTVELSLRDGNSSILLVLQGKVLLNEKEKLQPGELAIFDHKKAGVKLEVEEDLKALVMSGEPIEDPVVGYGPFVMNTEQEIFQAVQDYRNGRMGKLERNE